MNETPNVLMIAPGYPDEMPNYVRAFAHQGARVFGVSNQRPEELPAVARQYLTAHLYVPNILDDDAVVAAVREWSAPIRFSRIACMWEPCVILAAKLREALGVPGMTVAESIPFRDKDVMKQVLSAAGIRTPRHARAATYAECRDALAHIGFPAIIKPIDGAGSSDTYRIDGWEDFDRVIARVGHLPEANIEEFIEADEYTFDCISVNGEIAFHHIAWYRPRPLVARTNEWITPQIVSLRDLDAPEYAGGRAMGRAVLEALGFRTGFTHMEWYKKADGEIVFGEIAARPPGAQSVDAMNYACDIDLYQGLAEAELHGRFTQPIERRYNAALVFKRAQGEGIIRRIEGLDEFRAFCGPGIACLNLLKVGDHRRNWRQTLVSDGYMVLRDPSLARTLEMADAAGTMFQMYAEE